MDVHKKIVVYEMNMVMGNVTHQAITEVQFRNYSNRFNTEDEAIAALIKENMCRENFLLITQVYIN